MKKKKKLTNTSEWSFDDLKAYDAEISKIAALYQLDTFPNQIEIVTSEQMIDLFSAIGMPLGYYHWSYGKQFLEIEQRYRRGFQGIAYEIVINSNPAIAYLMEENSMTMQAIVIAHACYGHNSFFKNNYLFKTWTNPNSIIDYLLFSKKYITECEARYGVAAVEEMIDACHALMIYGVDRYQHPPKLSIQEEELRQKNREAYLQAEVNELWSTIPKKEDKLHDQLKLFPEEPQENILYFIEKHAPLLEPWQREIVRIVRKIAQYFYPQRQTKVMNEGWASFWHYILINDLYNQGLVTDEFMLEFLQIHTNVLYQPGFDEPGFSGLNPYTLGYKMFMDIKRICQQPTDEDKRWFPNLVNTDWVKAVKNAMENFKDESFIAQFLSPRLIRELKLFSILDDDQNEELVVSAIHNEEGYQRIRENLSNLFNISNTDPNIQVYNVNIRGDRSLTLRHIPYHRIPLNDDTEEVMKFLYKLWGFTVRLDQEQADGSFKTIYQCPAE